jgi:hypothetical protein
LNIIRQYEIDRFETLVTAVEVARVLSQLEGYNIPAPVALALKELKSAVFKLNQSAQAIQKAEMEAIGVSETSPPGRDMPELCPLPGMDPVPR